MIVTLMCEDKLYDVLLPKKICGRYWIEDPDLEITDQRKRIISIEGENDVWKIVANQKLKLSEADSDKRSFSVIAGIRKNLSNRVFHEEKGLYFTESHTQRSMYIKKIFSER